MGPPWAGVKSVKKVASRTPECPTALTPEITWTHLVPPRVRVEFRVSEAVLETRKDLAYA